VYLVFGNRGPLRVNVTDLPLTEKSEISGTLESGERLVVSLLFLSIFSLNVTVIEPISRATFLASSRGSVLFTVGDVKSPLLEEDEEPSEEDEEPSEEEEPSSKLVLLSKVLSEPPTTSNVVLSIVLSNPGAEAVTSTSEFFLPSQDSIQTIS